MPPTPKCIEGQRFGRLVVLRRDGRIYKGNVPAWLCLCDCGNQVRCSGNGLRYGNYRSCGCYKRDVAAANGRRKRLGDDTTAFRQALNFYTQGAKRRGLEWGLTDDDFRDLITGNCWYCGSPPSKRRPRSVNFVFGGIDRLDSKKSYTRGNCVSCCSECNYAKRAMPAGKFIAWLRRIQGHWNSLDVRTYRTTGTGD